MISNRVYHFIMNVTEQCRFSSQLYLEGGRLYGFKDGQFTSKTTFFFFGNLFFQGIIIHTCVQVIIFN